MEISPQRVRTAEFDTIKRGGLDPDAVREFLADVAAELERAQNQSTAMEARARAAVARLQELSENGPRPEPVPTSDPAPESAASPPATAAASMQPSVDEAETISRTLLLAQRTADTTVAEAEAEAERMTVAARDEVAKALEESRELNVRLVQAARDDARKAGASEKQAVETEVESLRARRDFLESDVDHLERHLVDERSRLREAATSLLDLTERVPGGLGEVRRPLMSASDDPTLDFSLDVADGGEGGDVALDDAAGQGVAEAGADDDVLVIQADIADNERDTRR